MYNFSLWSGYLTILKVMHFLPNLLLNIYLKFVILVLFLRKLATNEVFSDDNAIKESVNSQIDAKLTLLRAF